MRGFNFQHVAAGLTALSMNFRMCEGLSNKGVAAQLSSISSTPQFYATDFHYKRHRLQFRLPTCVQNFSIAASEEEQE